MPLLYEELFTCPNCKVIFQSKVLGGYNTFGESYSDLYVGSDDEPQPILHLINQCPKCGFTAFTIDFKTFNQDMEIVRQAIKKVIEFTGKRPTQFNVGDGYLVIANYSNNVSLEQKIFTFMQASYAYRILEDSNLNKTRQLILEKIKIILERKLFDVNPEELYLYLMGELNRLIGNEKESLDYFKQALDKAEKNSFVSRVTIHQLETPQEIIPKEIFGKQIK